VHGTGRAKTARRTASKVSTTAEPVPEPAPSKPVKTKSVIDQSPIPLYCSDECQLADLNRVSSYEDEARSFPLPMATRATASSSTSSDSDSTSSSWSHASARSYHEMSPSVATLAEMYGLPRRGPPPPPPRPPPPALEQARSPPSRPRGLPPRHHGGRQEDLHRPSPLPTTQARPFPVAVRALHGADAGEAARAHPRMDRRL
jgi:endogenous inhibitor of DNA gyrase (YacG/DUF329 family)